MRAREVMHIYGESSSVQEMPTSAGSTGKVFYVIHIRCLSWRLRALIVSVWTHSHSRKGKEKIKKKNTSDEIHKIAD